MSETEGLYTTMPGEGSIIESLTGVADYGSYQTSFYAPLARSLAGTRITPDELVHVIRQTAEQSNLPLPVKRAIRMRMEAFIIALSPEGDFRDMALAMWELMNLQ